MLNKIKKIFLYANAEKSDFDQVFDEITKENHRNLLVYSSISAVGMIAMILASFFDASLVKNRPAYLICAVLSFLLMILSVRNRKKSGTALYVGMYIFVSMLLIFGIILGTFVEPNEVSVSFPILMFAVPLFFTDRPIRMNIAVSVGIGLYYLAALYTQDEVMIGYNMSNILPYGIVAMVVGTYLMQIKVRQHVLEYQNKFLIESDQLTGILNRRSFEQHMEMLRTKGAEAGMLICAFDVNGLKKVNDTLGHHAGDELIRGAAQCIQGVFGVYGKCYRIGGDEFAAVLMEARPAEEVLKEALSKRCSCFNGVYVTGMSISIGMVEAKEGDNIDDLIRRADKEMYRDKKRYHELPEKKLIEV